MEVLTFKLFFSRRWENPHGFTLSRGEGASTAARQGDEGACGQGAAPPSARPVGRKIPVWHFTLRAAH